MTGKPGENRSFDMKNYLGHEFKFIVETNAHSWSLSYISGHRCLKCFYFESNLFNFWYAEIPMITCDEQIIKNIIE